MDDILKSLITDIDESIKQFQENEIQSKTIVDLIETDDIESLRTIIDTSLSHQYKQDSRKIFNENKTFKEESSSHDVISTHMLRKPNISLSRRNTSIDEDVFVTDNIIKKEQNKNEKGSYKNMQEITTFYNIESCLDRRIHKIEWCFDSPDIFAASYTSKKGTSFAHPDGLVLLWNTNSSKTQNIPINVFEFTHTITSIAFVKNEPALLVGGSVGGRILVWDTRVGRRSPVSLSLPTQSIITNSDIVSLKVSQSEYYSPITTIMSNSRICKWKLSMLTAAEEVIFEGNSLKYGMVMCGGISDTSDETCVIGTHTGNIVSIDPFAEDGPKGVIIANLKFPITSIAFHNSQLESARLPLFLSTSLDGSLRVWNYQKNSQLLVDNKFKNTFVEAKWCPTHPAVYSTSDSCGFISFCNTIKNSASMCQYKNEKSKLFTSMAWSPKGNTVALGKTNGQIITIYIDEKLVTSEKEDLYKMNAFAERQPTNDPPFMDRSDSIFEMSRSSLVDPDIYRSSISGSPSL